MPDSRVRSSGNKKEKKKKERGAVSQMNQLSSPIISVCLIKKVAKFWFKNTWLVFEILCSRMTELLDTNVYVLDSIRIFLKYRIIKYV